MTIRYLEVKRRSDSTGNTNIFTLMDNGIGYGQTKSIIYHKTFQKIIWSIKIFSLDVKDPVWCVGYIFLTHRSTFRPSQNSWNVLAVFCTTKHTEIPQNTLHFGVENCNFLDRGSRYQKSLSGAKQPPKVLQKTLWMFWDSSHNFWKNREKHVFLVKIPHFRPFLGGFSANPL